MWSGLHFVLFGYSVEKNYLAKFVKQVVELIQEERNRQRVHFQREHFD